MARFAFQVTDGGGGLEAVHAGHLDVHQNDVECLLLIEFDRVTTIFGDRHRMSIFL